MTVIGRIYETEGIECSIKEGCNATKRIKERINISEMKIRDIIMIPSSRL
jgi:hypothetical protein